MTNQQQYIHTAAELHAIADLLDAMNKFDKANGTISVQVGPEIWWCDRLMGHIVRQDEEANEGEWGYRPARGEDCTPGETYQGPSRV